MRGHRRPPLTQVLQRNDADFVAKDGQVQPSYRNPDRLLHPFERAREYTRAYPWGRGRARESYKLSRGSWEGSFAVWYSSLEMFTHLHFSYLHLHDVVTTLPTSARAG